MTRKRLLRNTSRKPTGALAALIEPKKATTVLLGDVQQHAVKRAQEDTSRRPDVIHPSEMAKSDWCPRQTAYRIRGLEPSDPKKVHGYQMLTIFQEGHDVHSKWQTWLGEMGRLWGQWECRVCGHTDLGVPDSLEIFGYAMSDSKYEHEHVWDYKEVPLDAEEQWLIEGHADGAVPDIESFIEVKTIGLGTIRMEEPSLVSQYTVKTTDDKSVVDVDSLWKGIKRPFKSHRKQAAIYLAIADHLGWPYRQMVFVYENKGNQQTKEFVVPFDRELAEELIDTAKDVKWAVETQNELPRPEGFRKDRKPCTECPWRTWCYAGEDATTSEQQDSAPEPDPPDGVRVPRSQAKTRPSTHPDADPARGRVPRSAQRPDRRQRQRPDAADDQAHEVGGVPGNTVGRSGGRRTVRRSRTRPS